jgi:hypothetical protein
VRGEASGNDTQISEAAQSGRLKGEVPATPSVNYDRVSHTLRLMGNSIVRDQEVMLSIQTGRPEGETEIRAANALLGSRAIEQYCVRAVGTSHEVNRELSWTLPRCGRFRVNGIRV